MHPIIFLWAHPRSMSTAIERVMRERGDLTCLHEPFLAYYYLNRASKPLPHFHPVEGQPTTYADTRDMILREAERGPVFAKDMSYYVVPELLEDQEFCTRIRHCFLVRKPERAILSYFRLDPEVGLEEIGLESQWLLFDGLRTRGLDDAPVLEAEAVQRDPALAMTRLWTSLGLDYKAEAFSWNEASTPEDWSYVQGWHKSVSGSTGIRQAGGESRDALDAEFARHVRRAPQLQSYLNHHRPYYEKLRAYSIS